MTGKPTYRELEKRIQELEAQRARRGDEGVSGTENEFFLNILDSVPAFIYLQAKDYTIRYSNKYFDQKFGVPAAGQLCHEVLCGRKEPCDPCPTFKVFESGEPQVWEWNDEKNNEIYEIYDYPFEDIDGAPLVLELGVNITEKKRAELSLKEAEKEIKTLRGILPICCYCKKIRDDHGYWKQLESYIHENSDAVFSHSICPECFKKRYPDIVDKEKIK